MSTIRPLRRTFVAWLSPVVVACGFVHWNGRQLRLTIGSLLVILIAFASNSVSADEPFDYDDPNPNPSQGRTSQPSSRDLIDDNDSDRVKIVNRKTEIDLTLSSSKTLIFQNRLLSVDGHSANFIDVEPLEPNRLRIRGMNQGYTTMFVTDEKQQHFAIDVFVVGDARELQAVLRRSFRDSAIRCQALKEDTVLLTGFVTDNQTIQQIMEVARTYKANVINHMRVGGPQEVQLRVKIIEVQRSKMRTFGVNFQSFTQNSVVASTPGPITPLSAFTNGVGVTPTLTLNPGAANSPSLTAGVSGNHFAFEGFLQALKEEGLLKVYTEPIIVTRSGEASRLSDGGEFPIPVPGGLGTVTIEFREFGVILESLPIVISPTRVKLQVSAEVSEKDVSNAITLNGTTVPGLTKRKVQSVVDMNFGHTMVIGGLILTRDVGNTYKTPFLGELPGVVGAAFRKVSYARAETETMVLITPEFGSSIPASQMPPGGPGLGTVEPNDRELYLHGSLETPNYGSDCGPDCRNNMPSRNSGSGSCDPEIPRGPTITPTPMNGPIPNGLIAPPGARPSNAIPPSPNSDPSVSRRTTKESKSVSKARDTAVAKKKKPTSLDDTEPVRPAGYRKSRSADQDTDN